MRPKLTLHERLLVGLALALACWVPVAWTADTQFNNLRRVRRHIRSIEPAWKEFKRANDGFELVRFSDYTADNGSWLACGTVPSEDHIVRLEEFMRSTRPPRPIKVHSATFDDREEYEDQLAESTSRDRNPQGL